jgi:predicted lipid-binding transport protein (Tim44 family)
MGRLAALADKQPEQTLLERTFHMNKLLAVLLASVFAVSTAFAADAAAPAADAAASAPKAAAKAPKKSAKKAKKSSKKAAKAEAAPKADKN